MSEVGWGSKTDRARDRESTLKRGSLSDREVKHLRERKIKVSHYQKKKACFKLMCIQHKSSSPTPPLLFHKVAFGLQALGYIKSRWAASFSQNALSLLLSSSMWSLYASLWDSHSTCLETKLRQIYTQTVSRDVTVPYWGTKAACLRQKGVSLKSYIVEHFYNVSVSKTILSNLSRVFSFCRFKYPHWDSKAKARFTH